MKRSAGILMSITSLPSPYGIGTIGKAAYEFADFLKEAGQKIWQILPVGQTSYGDSPYQSFSSFAGNPYMIDLDVLRDEGLLFEDEYNCLPWQESDGKVNYGAIYYYRYPVLRKAYKRFLNGDLSDFHRFCDQNNHIWLDDYAMYMSVKAYFDNRSWTDWDDSGIRMRKPTSMAYYSNKLGEDIGFWKFVQYEFFKQWAKFKKYVNSLGIKILGDMPIYVAMDSADTWANPQIFQLDQNLRPTNVAGCPPDYFSKTGQLWGNPLYRWDYLKQQGYDWWFKRLKSASQLFDITRIDHFRAFDAYYSIPYPAENAINGKWIEGPGLDFFIKMKERLGNIEIVAEDLGTLTPSVYKLMADVGYPGMKILEFAFGSGDDNPYLPHNYNNNCIVYTGTHDNDTVLGWEKTAPDHELMHAYNYLKPYDGEKLSWTMIRTAYKSKADYAIIQMQDFLNLGSEARMNTPSTLGCNWAWRVRKSDITHQLAGSIRQLVQQSGR